METTFAPGAASQPPASGSSLSKLQIRRAVLASVIGNGLEWFDFLIYGYFAKIIAQVFSPSATRRFRRR
jgi:MFS transporter, MHS family, proline/betaine transporter